MARIEKTKIITLDDVEKMAISSRQAIWDKAKSVNREPKIYLHWTAGGYVGFYDDYHLNIDGDGKIHLTCKDFAETLNHTYKRNTGSIGVTLCCCYNAKTNDIGLFPPKPKQIETLAQVIARLCDGLWLTIDKKHVMTHGEAADNEDGCDCHTPYGPKTRCERWDLEMLGIKEPLQDRCDKFDPFGKIEGMHRGGDILRGKANWYRQNKK